MLLGEIFQSIQAWQKLSAVNMKPKLAYKIYKYTKHVTAEYEFVTKQRDALIHEVTGTKEGEAAKVEPNSPEFETFATKFNEILTTESTLNQLDMNFEEVIDAVEEKEGALSVSDLAVLELFFEEAVTSEDLDDPPAVAGKIG